MKRRKGTSPKSENAAEADLEICARPSALTESMGVVLMLIMRNVPSVVSIACGPQSRETEACHMRSPREKRWTCSA